VGEQTRKIEDHPADSRAYHRLDTSLAACLRTMSDFTTGGSAIESEITAFRPRKGEDYRILFASEIRVAGERERIVSRPSDSSLTFCVLWLRDNEIKLFSTECKVLPNGEFRRISSDTWRAPVCHWTWSDTCTVPRDCCKQQVSHNLSQSVFEITFPYSRCYIAIVNVRDVLRFSFLSLPPSTSRLYLQ